MSVRAGKHDRWLALALLLAVLALVYLLCVHPLWTEPMLVEQGRIDQAQSRGQRVEAALRQAPQIDRELSALRTRLADRPGFLPESTVELATAGLVQRLEQVVAEASPGNRSCAITNRSPMTDMVDERYARVVVQARLRCGTPELSTVLYALESGSPRLFVDNLNILALRTSYLPVEAGRGNNSGGLDISFDLYGFLAPSVSAVVVPAQETTDAR
ncbi:MAG: type II secretion system protein GspM [Pseudoxanthomonas sp.]